uniref:Uncharacterized protein n=1 Tax=Sphaerodactylus townsendi TaxID=933632 RepID=A0ACB8G532_9SAUR
MLRPRSRYISQMKVVIYLSLLLIGVQFHCYHLIGPRDVHDNNPTKSLPDHSHPTSEIKCYYEREALHKIAPFNTDFAFRVYKHMASNQANQNILFSPTSISMAFALLSLGATPETRRQIYEGLSFNLSEIEEKTIHRGFCRLIHLFNQPEKHTTMKVGNALFFDKSSEVLPKFLDDAETFYDADIFYTNFLNSTAAKQQINDDVMNKTDGKIVDIVRDLCEHTAMTLVNYAYFEDYWKNSFQDQLTVEKDFFAHQNNTVRLNFMYQKSKFKILYDEDMSCSVVVIPCIGNTEAWFILPDKGKLKDVERSWGKENLDRWRTSFQYKEIELWMPKFSISTSYDLEDVLHGLGVTNIFDSYAGLSGIIEKHNLRVNKAVHGVQPELFKRMRAPVEVPPIIH